MKNYPDERARLVAGPPLSRRALLAAAAWVPVTATRTWAQTTPAESAPSLHVMLIGASIGQQWNLPDLPGRTGIKGFTFEALQAWQFDKSALINETLMRPARSFRMSIAYLKSLFGAPPRSPDIVIIKECSSYFPEGARPNSRALVATWIDQIRASGRRVALATVVPITIDRSRREPGKQEALREYNDWTRQFARDRSVAVVDLEAALRTDDVGRYLKDEFTSGDGSHLNGRAYAVADLTLSDALCAIFGGTSCSVRRSSVG